MNLLRKNLNGGVKGTLVGLFVIALIFGMSVRVGAQGQAFIQHCLSVFTDHYYLMYLMLPLFLLLCYFVLEDDSEVVIMRYKSYFRYFMHKWLSLVVISLLFIAVQGAAIAISAFGLPTSGGWLIAEGQVNYELFGTLSSIFATPALCLAAATAYMFVGLCVISMFFMWVGHFVSKSSSLKTMLSLYVLSLLSFRVNFIRELPLTNFNHLVILHHNLYATGRNRMLITAVTVAVLIALMIWTVKKHWSKQASFPKRQAKGITPYYCKGLISKKNILITSIVVALMLVWTYLQSGGGFER
jgi:hypothetical protein